MKTTLHVFIVVHMHNHVQFLYIHVQVLLFFIILHRLLLSYVS